MPLTPILKRSLRRLGYAAVLVIVLLAGAFGLLQTPIGQDWAARTLAGTISGSGFSIVVRDLEGTLPFDMRARRIEIADDRGTWLSLDGTHLQIAAGDLLRGRLRIGELTVRKIDVARLPQPAAADQPAPLSERLRLPRAPVAVALDRLSIERLALGPDILGETAEAAITGRAVIGEDSTEVMLDLHRIDGIPGSLAIELRQRGIDPALSLRLEASEPTGLLLGRLLNRSDRPPLLASLSGEGTLEDWRGRFEASAGQLARLSGGVTISGGRETVVAVAGTAAIGPLLPPGAAVLAGDSMPVMARVKIGDDGAIAIDGLSVDMAAGTLNLDLAFTGPERAISAHLRASLRDLAAASALAGQPMRGSGVLDATISGTEDRPTARIDLTGEAIGVGASAAEQAEAQATIRWSSDAPGSAARIEIAASGRLRGIAVPEGFPREFGRDLQWSLSARAAPDASAVEIIGLTARGAGIDLAGNGKTGRFGQDLDGKLRIAIGDIRPLTGVFGRQIEGAVTLDANVQHDSAGLIRATVDGSIGRLNSGVPIIDALAGSTIAITGSAERDGGGGTLRLDRLTLAGSGLSAAAAGSFDPGTGQLGATLDADIRDLEPAGKALGTRLSGQLSGHLAVEGTLDQPRLLARLEGRDVAAGGVALDRVRLKAAVADALKPRAAISGDFRAGGLDGTLSLEAEQNASELGLRRIQLKAGGSVLEADLRFDFGTLLARGTAKAHMLDLAPWSRLVGTPLAGKFDATAVLDARTGQSLDLTLNGDRLALGGGGGRMTLGHIAASARLNDLLSMPFGTGRVALSQANFPPGGLSTATVTFDSPRPGRFAFGADAKGRLIDPLTIALDGAGEISAGGAVEIRVSRLTGALGADRFQLTRPLTLAKRGGDLALSGLALGIGSGQVSGNAARRNASLSADLAIRNLSLVPAARLAGYWDVGGTLSGDLSLSGTAAAPQGRFALSGRELRFAVPQKQRLPTLGLDLAGTWNGRELALNGRVSGLKGDRLELNGSAPLVLTPSMALAVPPQGRLALRLQGAGEISNLADLLPLGEDRAAGRFALDAAIDGTPAVPAARGQLTITDGRYENFASGAVLTKIRLEVAGDRDRLTVREFSASDAATGTIAAHGSVNLAGSASADVSATLKDFRVVARDDALLAASGTVAMTGPVASPKIIARLTADNGDLSIPDHLPSSVTRLPVVEVNSRNARRAATVPTKPSQPAVPASLDIRVAVPGRVFVRGRGLDSEWRGQLTVTGTSDAPRIAGSLEVTRGTFEILGKTFKVVRGHIGFDGSRAIDPTLDIAAEISAADITAQVLVSGPASSPKIAITSVPVVPQDEILSRVLFNRAVGQITAAEGIQVAQAAATLAGGGPGVLDRLRGRLGLDRLVFGSAPSGTASSNLNPASGGNAASGTAISGGKYVTEGVYVGAAQGLTPQSSKVIVEIEVRPRVTVQGDFSQSGGSGIGLNYKYDY
jgi:translocation and assembly module TamB